MPHDYNHLLKLAYEIEGLLTLQAQRGVNAAAAVDEILADKIALLASLFLQSEEVVPAETEAPIATEAEATIAKTTVKTIPEDDTTTDAAMTIDDKENENENEPSLTLDEKLARQRAKDIFKAFTINDKFRFRRELFRNSQEEFDDALNVISQMSTIQEAEEYIYDDLCWDVENEDVKAFMDVVTKHF